MPTKSWLLFREELRKCLRYQHNLKQFERLKDSLPSKLICPEEVVAFLTVRDGKKAERDSVLRLLITRVQAGKADAEIAFAMLTLGRWRDLDLIYNRWRRAFRGDPTEVVSMIHVGFTTAVMRMNLTHSQNIEASLSLSTERPLHEWWADIKKERNHCDTPTSEQTSAFGFPNGMSSQGRFEILHHIARTAAGDEVEIVYAVDLVGKDLHEIAAELGISYDASKKRYQRAKERIKKAFCKADINICPRS
jgi:RNA polymerase sigma-70 factor (ECF subfamily)